MDITRAALHNTDYKRAVATTERMQVTVMSLPPGEQIGDEAHAAYDQMVVVDDPMPPGTPDSDIERMRSAEAHLSVSYPHTRVLHVANRGDALVALFRRLLRYLEDTLFGSGGLTDAPLYAVAQVAGERPRLDTQPRVWLETLTVPHRMSRATARAVAAVHPSAARLLSAYRRCARAFRGAPDATAASAGKKKKTTKKRTLDDALDAMLEDVPIGGGDRRLGPANSAMIRRTLLADAAADLALFDD